MMLNKYKIIKNILKIRGVKGSILLDLFSKGRQRPLGPPGYGPGMLIFGFHALMLWYSLLVW